MPPVVKRVLIVIAVVFALIYASHFGLRFFAFS
jgi:hypothetical protein